jgi:hypothetical protein
MSLAARVSVEKYRIMTLQALEFVTFLYYRALKGAKVATEHYRVRVGWFSVVYVNT